MATCFACTSAPSVKRRTWKSTAPEPVLFGTVACAEARPCVGMGVGMVDDPYLRQRAISSIKVGERHRRERATSTAWLPA